MLRDLLSLIQVKLNAIRQHAQPFYTAGCLRPECYRAIATSSRVTFLNTLGSPNLFTASRTSIGQTPIGIVVRGNAFAQMLRRDRGLFEADVERIYILVVGDSHVLHL